MVLRKLRAVASVKGEEEEVVVFNLRCSPLLLRASPARGPGAGPEKCEVCLRSWHTARPGLPGRPRAPWLFPCGLLWTWYLA